MEDSWGGRAFHHETPPQEAWLEIWEGVTIWGGSQRLEWTEVEWQGLGRQGSNGCQRLGWMDGRATPLAWLWGGVGLGLR